MSLKVSNVMTVTSMVTDHNKAPPKPRLIARSNEPKSPWKYHKIPTVSSKGLPPESKPLFSSILWSLYESEKNPLKPEKFVLLAGSSESLSLAEKLEIPVTMITSLRTYLLDIRLKLERRLQFGQLEATFPEALTKMGATNRACTLHNGMPTKNGDKSLNPIEQAIPAAEVQKDGTISKEEQSLLSSPPGPKAERKASEEDTAGGMPPVKESTLAMVTNPFEDEPKASISEVRNLLESGTVQLSQSSTSESSKATDPSPQLLAQPFRPSTAQKPNVDESDLDSDEEIIVFNPRARKTSGKKSREAPRSRPATANGPAPKILKSSPKEPSARSGTSAENKINGGLDTLGPSQSDGEISSVIEAEVQATIGKLKPKIESTLKAESPVFTPGKPFIQTLQQPVAELKPEASAESNRDSPPKSPSLLNNARNVPPRHPRAAMQQRHPSQERVRLQRESQQRESEKMIQRQRDAIQRRVKVVEKPSRKAAEKSAEAEPAAEKIAEKPPPRQIQLEPTNNPTVIDPDAFDRSYVVQPPASGSTTKSSVEKRRSRGHEHRRREAKRSQGSPKRNSKTPEPEVDYVLKSGAPRGSLRGKGKLWEP